MWRPREVKPILAARRGPRVPKRYNVPGHRDADPGVLGARLTSLRVRPKRPEVSIANGFETWARSAPAAVKQDSGIDRGRQPPRGESFKARVTSSIAPPEVPHRASAQRKPILTSCSGTRSTR